MCFIISVWKLTKKQNTKKNPLIYAAINNPIQPNKKKPKKKTELSDPQLTMFSLTTVSSVRPEHAVLTHSILSFL